jgi:hypothetical protein
MNFPDDYEGWDNSDPMSPFYDGGTVVCSLCDGVRDVEEMSDEDVCIYCVNED